MSVAAELLVILALVLANGVFAGAEIAILSVRRTRLRELAGEGSRAARVLVRMRSRPEAFLATVQIGITVVGTTAAAIGGATLARWLGDLLARAGLGAYADDVALASVIGLVSFLSLVLGELVPKSLALRTAERYALLVAWPLHVLSWLARPLVWFLTASSNLVLRVFHDRTTFSESRFSKEEIQQLVDEVSTTGELDPRAGAIAYRALDFGDVRVGALMVPRSEMVTMPLDASLEDAKTLLAKSAHTRIPVHRETREDIVGYVTAWDLLAILFEQRDGRSVQDILRPAQFVLETRPACEVLELMQRTRDQLAIVVDEDGVVSGLVTIEDIVEELVGEIFAEHETPLERIRRERDGTVLVRGRVPVHELNRELGLDLPERLEFSTIGGLATWLAGSIPPKGTRLDVDGTVLEIVDATDRRVLSVRLALPERADGAAAVEPPATLRPA